MTTDWRSRYWKLSFVSSLALAGTSIASYVDCTRAQIVPDGTLGAETSIVAPINGLPVDQIDGGAIRGANLFHSFAEFNVGVGRGAYFANPVGVENILSRVTGGNPSNILGELGVLGNANLFLINPNGIIFGPNASLNVRGSFVGTTANAVQFAEQGFFSASAPNTPPVLTVNPSAFLFNQIATASIKNNSTAPAGLTPSGANEFGLRVPNGRSLLLVGGDVSLENGGRLNALGGRVELGGLAELGTVGLGTDGNTFSLNFTPNSLSSNVTLADDARVNVRGSGGGNIVVNANTFTATNGGRLVAGTEGMGNGGDITVNANNFNISGVGSSGAGAGLYNQTLANTFGNAGNVFINTRFLNASSGSRVTSSTSGQGDAGNVSITASDTVSFDGVGSNGLYSGAFSTVESGAMGYSGDIKVTAGSLFLSNSAQLRTAVETGAVGEGGDIDITARSVSLTSGARLAASTFGQGDAGNVTITASDTVSFDSVGSNRFSSGAFSTVGTGVVGQGGDINITARSLSLTNSAQVATFTYGQAGETERSDAGNIVVNAADSLTVSSGAQLRSDTYGQGDAGNITLQTGGAVTFDGVQLNSNGVPTSSGVISRVGKDPTSGAVGIGKGGDIDITARSVSLTSGARLAASTLGQGDAGNVSITASDTVSFDGVSSNSVSSGASSTVETGAVGQGGDINVTARSVSITDGAAISSLTYGQGDAGNVNINASDAVTVAGVNSSSAFTAIGSYIYEEAIGKGGNINITTRKLSLEQGALVAAGTYKKVGETGRADAGNIQVNVSDSLTVSGGSGLISTTFGQGDAGKVTIAAENAAVYFDGVGSNGSPPSGASSLVDTKAVGQAGDINITARSVSLTSGAQLAAYTFGKGDAGNVSITASDTVSFDGVSSNGLYSSSGAFTIVGPEAVGQGGDINITARSFSLTNEALVTTSTVRKAGETERADAGKIVVNVADSISVSGLAQLDSSTYGQGDAGDITLQAGGAVTFDGVSSGAFSAVSFSQDGEQTFAGNGRAGDINITAGSLSLSNGAELRTAVEDGTVGEGGDINVTAGSVSLATGAQLIAGSAGRGNAGNVTITASDTVSFDGVGSNGPLSGSVSVTDGAAISSITQGQGDAGNVNINASAAVTVAGVNSSSGDISTIASAVDKGAIGNGGNITIGARSLFLTNGAQLRADTTGWGDAGDVKIEVSDTVSLEGFSNSFDSSGIASSVRRSDQQEGVVGTGQGGDISIKARSLFLNNGTVIDASTYGQGSAGNISIQVDDAVSLSNYSLINTVVGAGGEGNGGDIDIQAGSLSLTHGAEVSSQSQGTGPAGKISINARQTLTANNGKITTAAAQSTGGTLDITAKDILLQGNSDITTNVSSGAGGGGNINLTADSIFAFGDSDILAFARDGRGGNIILNTPIFFGSSYQAAPSGTDPATLNGNNRVDINASGGLAVGNIALPDTSLIQNSLTELPTNPIDTNTLLANSCIARSSRRGGSFIITGAGGLPSRPGDAEVSPFSTGAVRSISGGSASSTRLAHQWKLGDPIVEPQGVYRLPSGQLVLSRQCSQ